VTLRCVKTFTVGTPQRVAIAVVAVLAVGIGVALTVFILGAKELRHKTQAELLAAVPKIASDELYARGHHLTLPLACRNMPGATKRSMRVSCVGMTAKKERVMVIGTAEDEVKEEYFTILVDGRPLVQNVNCLGADCRAEKD
jgi:hypothetical protein